jgi:hypothetical protein
MQITDFLGWVPPANLKHVAVVARKQRALDARLSPPKYRSRVSSVDSSLVNFNRSTMTSHGPRKIVPLESYSVHKPETETRTPVSIFEIDLQTHASNKTDSMFAHDAAQEVEADSRN